MSGHFPFSGNTNRVSVFGFYDRHNLNTTMQEKYYKWWYDWAKNFVMNDPDLSAVKGYEFKNYPYGQHSHTDFHLHQGLWATTLIDLGGFITGTLFGKMSDEAMHKLEEDHHHLLHKLEEEAKQNPRPASPDIGWFRHF
ncbi:MAG: hypothetical protein WC426_08510 [Sulfuriferula sp.]